MVDVAICKSLENSTQELILLAGFVAVTVCRLKSCRKGKGSLQPQYLTSGPLKKKPKKQEFTLLEILHIFIEIDLSFN